jgi:hypothetical protein
MAISRKAVTEQTRAFLAKQGVHPSVRLGDTYDDLYLLMRRRQADAEFWQPLTELLRAVIRGAVEHEKAVFRTRPEARLLATWDVNELVERLREALALECEPAVDVEPAGTSNRSRRAWFTRSLTPSALGAFLLLGLVAGCDNGDGDASGSPSGGTTSTGGTGGVGGTIILSGIGGTTGCPYEASTTPSTSPLPAACEATDASALWTAIREACLYEQSKAQLFTCFASLKASWCDGLTTLFETQTPEQIAAELSTLLNCCDGASDYGVYESEYDAAMQQRLLEGMCYSVILYKGVAFPDEENAEGSPS